MTIEKLKEEAIKILDNPNSTSEWGQWALNFANWYKNERKKRIDEKLVTPPEERAVLVDQNGRIKNISRVK